MNVRCCKGWVLVQFMCLGVVIFYLIPTYIGYQHINPKLTE